MNFADVLASVKAERLDDAVARLQELPVESVSLEQIRPWIFHSHTPLRQLVVTLLGLRGDIDSILDLANLFAAELDFYDHDFIFEAYARMGEVALPGLLDVTRHGSPNQRSAAIQGLGHMRGPAVPVLVELLQGGENDCLIFIALQNCYDARAVPALLTYLVDHKKDEHAAYALSNCTDETCGGHIQEMAMVLRGCRSKEVCRSVLQAMGATKAPAAVEFLREHLLEPDAAEGLSQIAHPEAVEALCGALKEALPPEPLDAILSAILTNPVSGSDLRREAARICLSRPDLTETLEKIAEDPACAPELELAAQSQDPSRRLLLANALDKDAAAPHYEFVSLASDQGLLRELVSEGSRLPLSLIENLAKHPDDEIRRRLAKSMRFTGKSIPVLTALLSDRRAKVRETAARSLDRVSEALPQLSELHRDRSLRVRCAAANSIRRMEDVSLENRIRALSLFLYDRAGRPIDLKQGTVIPFDDSEERPYMLSEAIVDLEHPLAEKVVEEWRGESQATSLRWV